MIDKVRDTRIDVIRALALITIFVNHIPKNPLDGMTSRNFGFSDAAEMFVLLSGMSAALAFGLKFDRGSALGLARRMWRRAGALYLAHVGMTLATLVVFFLFAAYLSAPEILQEMNIAPVVESPAAALAGVLALLHQIDYNNVLTVYIVALLALPAFLAIGRVSLSLMVAVSGLIWFCAGAFAISPWAWPGEQPWFFNPFSWQFLFVIGVAVMLHAKRGGRIAANPYAAAAAAAYLLLSMASVRLGLLDFDLSMGLAPHLGQIDKTYLSAPRLLHVLALAYLFAAAGWTEAFRLDRRHPLAVLGRHGLPVFVAGTLVCMAAMAWRLACGIDPVVDLAIVAAGIAVQFALALWLEAGDDTAKLVAVRPVRA